MQSKITVKACANSVLTFVCPCPRETQAAYVALLKALIKALCDAGIRDIKLNVNDVDYNLTIDATDPKELSFELPLVEGNNKITFTVISVNGTEKQEVKEIVR